MTDQRKFALAWSATKLLRRTLSTIPGMVPDGSMIPRVSVSKDSGNAPDPGRAISLGTVSLRKALLEPAPRGVLGIGREEPK